jgi:AH receptor-interacting protein
LLCIAILLIFIFREKPNDEEWLELRDMKIPLLLNYSQCKLSKKEYYAVIEHTTEVLEADPSE